MNRRTFLRWLGVGAAMPALAKLPAPITRFVTVDPAVRADQAVAALWEMDYATTSLRLVGMHEALRPHVEKFFEVQYKNTDWEEIFIEDQAHPL